MASPKEGNAPIESAGFGATQSWKRTAIEAVVVLGVLALVVWGAVALLGVVAEGVAVRLPASIDTTIGNAGGEAMRAQSKVLGDDDPRTRRTRVVFDRLVENLTPEERRELGALRLTVIEDAQVNAFAMPGGEVFVLTGLLDRAKDDDALVEGVLAHELGHAIKRHGTRTLARSSAVRVAVFSLIGGDSEAIAVLATGAVKLTELSYSRDMETEADAFGADLLQRMGKPVDGLARFLESLESQPVPEMLSTHPDPKARADELRKR